MNHNSPRRQLEPANGASAAWEVDRVLETLPQAPGDACHLADAWQQAIGRQETSDNEDSGCDADGPIALITRFASPTNVDFNNSAQFHHFNLQLAGTLQLELYNQGRWAKRSVVPGHTSLNVAHDAFRCIVGPSRGTLAVDFRFTPAWLEQVADAEQLGPVTRASCLAPRLGEWQPQVRDAAWGLARALRQLQPTRLCLEEHQLALAITLLQSQASRGSSVTDRGQLPTDKLRRAIDYLLAHLHTDLRLTRLAAEVGLSPFHFARVQSQCGVGPPPICGGNAD